MDREVEDDDNVKVHEIKFDEYGIMDDGLDDSTEKQLADYKAKQSRNFFFFLEFCLSKALTGECRVTPSPP
jgi:hypothetical protein